MHSVTDVPSIVHSPPDLCGNTRCPCDIAGILSAERSLPEWTHEQRAYLALAVNFALANRPLPLAVLRIIHPLREAIIARLDALEPDGVA